MITQEAINSIFEIFYKNNPTPRIELNYTNNFTLLMAVVLSAQSTDVGVNKATEALFANCATPQAILELGEERLKSYIKTIGLFNSKAKNIISTARILVDKYSGEVPNDFDTLITLPGVGRKSANVILSAGFQVPTMPVDTHIFRVSRRIGMAVGNTPDKVEHELLKIIPHDWIARGAHHWLVLHGRYTCKARKPLCDSCPINTFCEKNL